MSDDRLDKLDYYTLLQVPQDARPDAIREAFHAFAKRYHPDRFAGATPEKRARAGEIYRRGAEAYRVLMSAELRRRYDSGLADGQLRLQPEQQERPSTGSGLTIRSPRARPFATQALNAYRAGDYKVAKLNLQMALNHEPDNAILKARLADVEEKLRASSK
ncbi:MAG: DnaJ domain-containing protein [Sandaracinaceae bacterium]|nr:DnaJ domain-containing protein [Sandaracinaceae bacterium]